ncbi:MAG TPA: hypothetical protein DCW88_24545 [Agrobacterium sp.]|nr:hypothetical protein [Agrobacterium sp.]
MTKRSAGSTEALHRHPETGLCEDKTSAYVASLLEGLGYAVTRPCRAKSRLAAVVFVNGEILFLISMTHIFQNYDDALPCDLPRDFPMSMSSGRTPRYRMPAGSRLTSQDQWSYGHSQMAKSHGGF